MYLRDLSDVTKVMENALEAKLKSSDIQAALQESMEQWKQELRDIPALNMTIPMSVFEGSDKDHHHFGRVVNENGDEVLDEENIERREVQVKRGNKQQTKQMLIPSDYLLVQSTKQQEAAELEEEQDIQRLVLEYIERDEEEANGLPFPLRNPQIVRRTSMSSPSTTTNGKESSPVSMPYLPDDLLLNCLARVSRLYYPTLSLVSKRFRSLLSSTDLYETRRLLGSTESCPYVCLMSSGSSKPRWFTLSRGPTVIPNSNSRWFTSSCFNPCRIPRNRTRNLMVSVPSHNFSPPSRWTPTAIGSNIYMIGGYINREPSSRVFVMDCRSHIWHEAPSMRVARKSPIASVLDGKIYVVEVSRNSHPSNFMEFFDPKTQKWEHAPSPGAEIRGTYILRSFAMEGNLYVIGDKNVVYKPKENKWVALGFGLGLGAGSKSSCMIDNVTYCYAPGSSMWLKWERSSWIPLKGLEKLPKLPKDSDCVTLENYGGKIAVFWEENVFAIGSTKKKMIWCAEIAIERHNGQEVCGKVEWYDVVLTVPKSSYFEQFIVATV